MLAAVSTALDTPQDLIKRSAAARAAANGTSVDDVLAAWSGGAPLAAPAPAPAAAEQTPTVTEAPVSDSTFDSPAPQAETAGTTHALLAQEPIAVAVLDEPEGFEPVPVGQRVRAATRVGAWTGGILGLIGFLVATTRWAGSTTVTGEGPYSPVIQAGSTSVILGLTLVSVFFGAVVAGLSRSVTGWVNPGMRLSNSARSTTWIGGFLGLVLGVVAGALLTSSFGTPIEGSEGLIQMPVLATVWVMIVGGAFLGGLTAAITQAVGVPVSVTEDRAEIVAVKGRLTAAVAVPMTALVALLILVLPFAWALLESNGLTSGGAAIVGVITAIGILVFASLAGSRPSIKLSLGEGIVAVIGIVTVVGVIVAVFLARGSAG